MMCGGIAISQCVRASKTNSSEKAVSPKQAVMPSFFYNLGRVVSYTVIGGIAGGLGSLVGFTGPMQAIVPIFGGIFMIILAINMLGIFTPLRKLNIHMPYFIARKLNEGNRYSPLIVGLLNGLMPCGPLQIVQLYALSTRSVFLGAASMFVFVVGTIPVLFSFGLINSILNKKFSKITLKISALLVLILGLAMIGRGLALTGVSMDIEQESDVRVIGVLQSDGKSQIVTSEITADSYPVIVVQKGVPVKWIVSVKEENLNDCNNKFIVPTYKIEKSLSVGDNIVEFTPAKTGEIGYTCWMGMIKSKIVVVDSLKNIKER